MFLMGFQRTKRKGSDSPLCRLFAMSAAYVAHFVFEITLSQAITLTLLLVCSFSPRVQVSRGVP